MTVASVKHWQWLLNAVLAGLVLWGVRRWGNGDPGRLGDVINDPARFERALTTRLAGIPAFKDARVYRTTLEDGAGASKPVHVVSGKYCDGQVDPGDGKYHWRPAVFVAPIPYRPSSDVHNLVKVRASMRYRSQRDPTVVDFLQLLRDSDLVDYTHAWWDTYAMATWFGGSVVVLGFVWPVAINLVVFGRLFRPREKKGVDLSKVRPGSASGAAARGLSDEDLEELRRLEAELKNGLTASGPTAAGASKQEASDRTPPPLVTEPVVPVTAEPGDATAFGAKADDFYPTARPAAKRAGETSSSLAVLAVAAITLAGFATAGARAALLYTGVNLAGAEFTDGVLPGVYNAHYTYPTRSEVDYFVGKGANTFRLPFRWERLQRSLNAPFDAAELGRVDAFVSYATSNGGYVVLDPHNYARYDGTVVGTGPVTRAAFSDFWSRLATRYKGNDHVIFGLMNEPNNMPSTEHWVASANAAIAGIRAAGAPNLILVPGNGWSGGHSWTENWYGTPNATAMPGITDPLDHYAFEVHQYLNADTSGGSDDVVSPTIGRERLQSFTQWLRQHGERGFLGEFGTPRSSIGTLALDNMLDYVDANADVWAGWTYWAAGPWWGDYRFTVEPTPDGRDRPQMAVLEQHFVPEPSALGVWAVGAAWLCLRPRRRVTARRPEARRD
jgi:endoglucanase